MNTGLDLPEPIIRILPGLTNYHSMLEAMEAHVDAIHKGTAGEEIWLVEHAPVITAGTSSSISDLIEPNRFPIINAGRGGKFTYHGPGQRVIYPLLNLNNRGKDIRHYVQCLESWAIQALGSLGVQAFPHDAGTGIWVNENGTPSKIGAIGVRVRRWITYHGMALNVSTDLSHYNVIIPCGIQDFGVTRLQNLKADVTMNALDEALRQNLPSMLRMLSKRSQTQGKV